MCVAGRTTYGRGCSRGLQYGSLLFLRGGGDVLLFSSCVLVSGDSYSVMPAVMLSSSSHFLNYGHTLVVEG